MVKSLRNPAAGRQATNHSHPRKEILKMHFVAGLIGLAIGFTEPILAQQKNTVDPQITQQIRVLAMKYDEAFNRSDATAVAALYTKDAIYVIRKPMLT
jgi:hypothetical protein